VCGPWPLGEGGTITFLTSGKVAVGVGGPAFEEQKKKVISRFNVDAVLLANLENAFCEPSDILLSQILREIIQITDKAQLNRRLDELVSTLRALNELWIQRFETRGDSRFTEAVRTLATEHRRSPTKAEITEYLCQKYFLYAPSRTSEWCQEHGFSWLPTERPGRRD
jgi:hypothetical protein